MTPTELADLLFGETRTMIDRAKTAILADVRAMIEAIPAGKDGRDGLDGKDGRDGTDGKDGRDGEKGDKGDPGERGEKGEPGTDGRDGADGKSVTVDEVKPILESVVERHMSTLVLPAGRRGEKGADGRDGRDGKDGRDGIATRDELISLVREAVTLAVPDAVDRAITEAIKSVPKMEYHGVWTQREFAKGDTVTFGGSLWICRAAVTTGKPGECDDWQLAVKRGRDAR